MSDDLLRVASGLANVKRPTEAHFRKAMSSAYYAAFHSLCKMVADEIVGSTDNPIYVGVYRKIDHRNLGDKDTSIFNVSKETSALRIALDDLRQKRMEADYDPRLLNLKKKDIEDIVGSARNVIDMIQNLSGEHKRILSINLLLGKNSFPSRAQQTTIS